MKQVIVEDDNEIAMLEKVLLDLMLPGSSGYDICREIRDKIDIPILIVTAKTESFYKVRGLGLGADDYIAMLWPTAKSLFLK